MSAIDKALFTLDLRSPITHLSDRTGAATELLAGRVLHVGYAAAVDIDGDLVRCRRAASCLLEPAAGDRVLAAVSDGESYILAVLERPSTVPAALSVNVPSETTVLRGGEISIAAEQSLQLEAPAVSARTPRFTVLADAIGFVGELLTQAVARWRSATTHVEIVSTEIATKTARRTSIVEETDLLQAGALVQTIATAAVTSTQSAVVAAEQDLRLDAERVTVG